MTDTERINAVFKIVEQNVMLVESLHSKLSAEVEGRLKMCMAIMEFTVQMKNHHNALARRIASSALFADNEVDRNEFVRHIAQLETECERLESIISKANVPSKTETPSQPGADEH